MQTQRYRLGAHYLAMVTILALAVAFAGCGRKNAANGTTATTAGPTALEQVLKVWQQGDQAGALQRILETDWKTGPIFSPGSALAHKESELSGMGQAEMQKVVAEAQTCASDFKKLAAALRDKGVAAAGGDRELARRCFSRLDDLGAALDQSGLQIVRLSGQAIRRMAATESTKLGQ